MGENGAGKSTLMKCLFGIYHMDEGEVYVDGKKVDINNPDEALHKVLIRGTFLEGLTLAIRN